MKIVNENLKWTDGTYLLLYINLDQCLDGINGMYKNDK